MQKSAFGVELKTSKAAGKSLMIVKALTGVRLRSDSTGQKRRLWHSRLFLDGALS